MINKVEDFLWYFFARQFKNHQKKRRKINFFFDIKSIKFLISLIRHKKATPQKNAFEKSLKRETSLKKTSKESIRINKIIINKKI